MVGFSNVFHSLGFSRISKFSRISRNGLFWKDPFPKDPFSEPEFVLICSRNTSEENGANRNKSVYSRKQGAQIGTDRMKTGKSEQIGVIPFCRPQIGRSERKRLPTTNMQKCGENFAGFFDLHSLTAITVIGFQSRPILRHPNTYYLQALWSLKNGTMTKARVLKHDLPVHGKLSFSWKGPKNSENFGGCGNFWWILADLQPCNWMSLGYFFVGFGMIFWDHCRPNLLGVSTSPCHKRAPTLNSPITSGFWWPA